MERNFYQRFFLSYQKIISFMDVFIILQLSANDFWVRTKAGKQQHYNKLKQVRYFNVINIAECWCEIGCTLYTSECSVINQVEVSNFPLLHFPRWFFLIQGQLGMSLRRMNGWSYLNVCLFDIQQWSVFKVLLSPSLKCTLKEIHLRVIATFLFSIFIHQNTKSTT